MPWWRLVALALVVAIVAAGCTTSPSTAPADAIGSAADASASATAGTSVLSPLGLTNPFGIAVDRSRNVYVSDSGHSRVVRYSPISGGYAPPTTVPFVGLLNPQHVAVDGDGSVYVADTGNLRVVRLPRGDEGFGAQATLPFGTLSGPQGVAVDDDGDVYVVDSSFIAGAVVVRLPRVGDGYGSPETLPFTGLSTSVGAAGIAVDDAGSVYVGTTGLSTGAVAKLPRLADGWGPSETIAIGGAKAIRGVAVTAGGAVLAADPFSNVVFELGGPAPVTLPLAGFRAPNAVAVDVAGNVFVAGGIAGSVLRLPAAIDGYGPLTTLPRPGLSEPGGLAIAPGGDLIVGDAAANEVLRLPRDGSADDRGATVASTLLDNPTGIALDADGSVYVANSSNATFGSRPLVKVPFTEAGYGAPVAIPVGSSTANDVALDGHGNLLVATGTFGAGQVSRLVRNDSGGFGAPVALPFGTLGAVNGLAVGPTGDVYVATGSSSSGSVVRLPRTPDGWGTPVTLPFDPLGGPVDVAVDRSGNAYVLDNLPVGSAGALVFMLPSTGDGYGTPTVVPFDRFDRGRSLAVRPSGSVVATVTDAADNASVVEATVATGVLVQGDPLRATVREGDSYDGQLSFLNATGAIAVEQTNGDEVTVDADGAISAPDTLDAGTYTAAGTATDAGGATGGWTFELVVEPAPAALPRQTAPFSGTTYAGQAYSGQLAVADATGDVKFRVVDGNGVGVIEVSASGAVSVAPSRPSGSYLVRGTMRDDTGATGVWTFSLDIVDSIVCRGAAGIYPIPTGTVITAYLSTQGCGSPGPNNSNAVRVARPVEGLAACQAPFASSTGRPYFAIPTGFVVTAYLAISGCSTPADVFSSHQGANAIRLGIARDGTVVCQIQSSTLGSPQFSIPSGYVVTAYLATTNCGAGGSVFSTFTGRNSARIALPRDGIVACQREAGWGYRTPSDHVVTAYLNSANCGTPESVFSNRPNTNSARIARPFDGVVVCQVHAATAGVPWYSVPAGYRRTERRNTNNCGVVASIFNDHPNTNSIRIRPA